MTKQDAAWLGVRSAGVVFACFAFGKITGFIYVAYILTHSKLHELQDTLESALSWNMAWPHAVWFVVYSILAYYLLRHGSLLHRILCWVPTGACVTHNDQQ
jgi:hypothetical protein